MSAHTPGPWHTGCFVDPESACQCRSILAETMCGSVCQISLHNGIETVTDGSNDCPPLEEARANARLIAAAPELLVAAEAAYLLALQISPVSMLRIKNQATLAALRNVIASATGRDDEAVQNDFSGRAFALEFPT